MAFTEDFDVFINDDTPGYKVLKINYVDVAGVFDDDYEEVGFTESSNPIFVVESSDVTVDTKGSLAIEETTGKEWEVIGVQDDGTGITNLELRVKWYE